jgi:BirA family biotin operon repressor/biotin-[acetyl-CoA-carboxylase] ligase
MTLASAVAVRASLKEFQLKAKLSWPNDLIVLPHHRKVGGILVESVFEGDLFVGSVVGVGINITLNPDTLTMPLSQTVTSFSNEKINTPDLALLSTAIRSSILERTVELESGLTSQLLDAWREHNITIGSRIAYMRDQRPRQGTALDLDENGALIIEEDHAGVVKVHSGEVRLVVNSETQMTMET